MQIAVLLSAAVPAPPGSAPAAEGEVSFEAHLQAAQAQQETPPELPETAAHPAPEVIPVPPQVTAEAEAEVEVVPPAELLPSALPIQEWEALAWVQQHVPPVAPPPVAVMAPLLPEAPVPPPQPAAVSTVQEAVVPSTAPPAAQSGPVVDPKAEAPVTLMVPLRALPEDLASLTGPFLISVVPV